MTRLSAVLIALSVAAAGCGKKHECASGQTECNGVCRDPASFDSDPQNCGGCLIACGFGTCAGGVCQCETGTQCSALNPRCRHLDTDPASCGQCGHACTRPGEGCAGGVCQCVPPRPNDCTTFCTDLQTDPANCNACGHDCPLTNDICVGGACQCPAALPNVCVNSCVNEQTDPRNCGSCAHVCPLANEACVAGSCACAGAFPDTCPNACVNEQTDPQHCGSCTNVCAGGATCTSGACHCPTGEVACGAAPGTCVNEQTDAQHCGSCANVCPTGASCTSGTCHCPQGPAPGCGTACCAGGSACCLDATCPPPHSNGLGGNYFDCGAQDAHTLDQARLAAISWSPTGATTEGVLLCANCLCRQSATQAAVWCYSGSPMSGLVALTNSPNCLAATCPFAGGLAWH